MRLQIKLLVLALGIAPHAQATTIKVLYTAALLDHHFESRKQEYLHSLGALYQLGFEPHIVVGGVFINQRLHLSAPFKHHYRVRSSRFPVPACL